MSTVIKVEGLSKQYRLGQVGTGTISHDINRWWHKLRGNEDPYLKIGETNDRVSKGGSEYVWALKDIQFNVEKGDVIGIIGRNGAGKSTLLKILSRTTTPSKGFIKIKGRVASLLEVGTGFHPELSGRENVFLNGAILGMSKQEILKKFDEIVDFAGVERYIDTPVKRYSSGMYVRLAFGVAAHLEPEILIVDEVLAVGDAEFQKKALGKMKDVSDKDGRTVLFVSHNMAAVKNLCSKGIYLKNGELYYQGTSGDTIKSYLGDTGGQMNTIIAERTDRIGTGKIKVIDIRLRSADGNIITEIMAGDYLKIEFVCEIQNGVNVKDMILACNFSDQYENRIVSWVSDEMKNDFGQIKNNTFCLEIPAFNVRPGNYLFNYQISILDTMPENFSDVLTNAVSLDVLGSDFFKSGMNIREGNSLLLAAGFTY